MKNGIKFQFGKRRGVIADTIMGGVGIITLAITVIVVAALLTNATLTGFTGINATIASYVPTLMLVGGLGAAAYVGLRQMGVLH
jgi:ABC-type uncharacterized transport system YnjBCD permease subunit